MTIQSFGGMPDAELPVGTVVMWAGALADIPAGWALCDGNNATLDFTARFIKGPSSAADSPGATGGADSFSLSTAQLPSHRHTGSTGSAGEHRHGFPKGSGDSGTGGSGSYNYNIIKHYGAYSDKVGMSWDPDHNHSVSIGNTGSGNSIENRPSYYELAFIQKL